MAGCRLVTAAGQDTDVVDRLTQQRYDVTAERARASGDEEGAEVFIVVSRATGHVPYCHARGVPGM